MRNTLRWPKHGWAEQERLIKLGSWEPPRIEKTKELSSTITFREYALDFVQNRRKPNGQRIAPTTREKYLQYLDDYLLPVLGDKPMGSIGPRDIEKWADSMRVGKAGEGASVKHKAYVLLREIFRDACEAGIDQDGTTRSNPIRCTSACTNRRLVFGTWISVWKS